MEYIIICIASLIASGLTLFSGFGLGTVLFPVFAIFFPIKLAIALTAIVHFLNNIFKLTLLGKNADKNVIIRFGIPSIATAFIGASVLLLLADMQPLFQYSISNRTFMVLPVKLIIGILLMFFAMFDILPGLASLQFDKKYLPLGGVLSGFFGGLSGNQGALRSAFLIRANLTKESFIATGVVIACLIDITRLSVYSQHIISFGDKFNYMIITAAALSAFTGAFAGNLLLKKITIITLQYTVAVMLFVFAVLLMIGMI